VIGLAPGETGSVKVRVAEESPRAAVSAVGASGVFAIGVTVVDALVAPTP
jgi:predicted ThiF/HesA family dinucleotide-utilizing enzyme